ncbi:uncharacterized protein YraI [Mesorhizobium sp. J18]|uniref:DUF1236 domain-containing protein n=1 Tax=Mesorhizobium sp. J18 TaxID=935263 RepID=UPI00119B5186|nr:DUF1236 domain-containing protein [Mesorhizobium sp. J18]TWG97886.1 uncharacterized protein YraI [Mesorhizobium sp. J18]
MTTHFLKATAAAAALMALTGAASAQTAVTATADLNIRSGPGPQYPVVGVIGASGEATLDGCIEGSKWCRVNAGGVEGWAYSDYLTATFDSRQVIVTERPAEAVPLVTYESTSSTGDVLVGRADGSVASGTLIGRSSDVMVEPVAAPPPEVRTYITSNEVDPVYLDGEVVVGASVPETVVMREIPDYQYRYSYVNGQPVLIEPQSRRIVYVVRQ